MMARARGGGRVTVDILCRVLDNFGDIGVVYRLAKALSALDPGLKLRLSVDNLEAFKALEPAVAAGAEAQRLGDWELLRWGTPWPGFRSDPPRLVLECFACGRPAPLEEALFDPARGGLRHIVNIEYLSAEAYADELHLMPSATRSPLVKKHIFMPGFTPATGGLIIDPEFRLAMDAWGEAKAAGRQALARARAVLLPRLALAAEAGPKDDAAAEPRAAVAGGNAAGPSRSRFNPSELAARFWLSIFSYERDYGPFVAQLARLAGEEPLAVLAAAGRSQSCLIGAWERADRPFPLIAVPFLKQEDWDELLCASDAALVRGEESLSRAALAGIPFLWHAYLQEGGYHQVKVAALCDRLAPSFEASEAAALRACFMALNERVADGPEAGGDEDISAFVAIARREAAEQLSGLNGARAAEDLISAAPRSQAAGGSPAAAPGEGAPGSGGYAAFGRALRDNGDMALRLLTFLRALV